MKTSNSLPCSNEKHAWHKRCLGVPAGPGRVTWEDKNPTKQIRNVWCSRLTMIIMIWTIAGQVKLQGCRCLTFISSCKLEPHLHHSRDRSSPLEWDCEHVNSGKGCCHWCLSFCVRKFLWKWSDFPASHVWFTGSWVCPHLGVSRPSSTSTSVPGARNCACASWHSIVPDESPWFAKNPARKHCICMEPLWFFVWTEMKKRHWRNLMPCRCSHKPIQIQIWCSRKIHLMDLFTWSTYGTAE